MVVALARFDLRIPGCVSLKQKRHVVKSITGGMRTTFNVSVAEVEHHDLWQRTGIGVAVVGIDAFHVRQVMQRVERFVEAWGGVELIAREVSLHRPEA